MTVSPEDFSFYKKFLYEKSGLSLGDDKVYLVVSRLTPVARKWGFNSLSEMTKNLKLSPDRKMLSEIIDAMTTNETLFFRDDRPFKYFKTNLLPEIIKNREIRKSIRIWSAACSTGQEPYSIAMSLLDILPNPENWKIDLVATDISENALNQARRGEFNQFEIQRGMPIQLLMKYFKQDGQNWKIADKVRNLVRFENFNLLNPMDKFGTFDIIFCRNVLIYFDETTKKKVIQGLVKRMAPDGYIFLGGSETAIGLCPELKINAGCPGLYTMQSQQPASGLPAVESNPFVIFSTAGATR